MEKNKILSLVDNPLEGELYNEDEVEFKCYVIQNEELAKLIDKSMNKWLKGESNGSEESR